MEDLTSLEEPKINIIARLTEAKACFMGDHLNKGHDESPSYDCGRIDLQDIIFKCIIQTKREAGYSNTNSQSPSRKTTPTPTPKNIKC